MVLIIHQECHMNMCHQVGYEGLNYLLARPIKAMLAHGSEQVWGY